MLWFGGGLSQEIGFMSNSVWNASDSARVTYVEACSTKCGGGACTYVILFHFPLIKTKTK